MIVSGKFFYKGQIVEGCIEVEGGVIVGIRKTGKADVHYDGLILPAGVDVHVHFRDFRESHKETIETGSLSALFGGICLVVDQPNTDPPVTDSEVYLKRIEVARRNSYVDYSLNFCLTEENVERLAEEVRRVERYVRVPAIGEVFLTHPRLQVSYETLSKALKIGKLLTVHAEDPSLIRDGERPKEAEMLAVKKCVEIGCEYFCHISSYESLTYVKRHNRIAEVTPHHMLLKQGVVNPPIREDGHLLLKNFKMADVLASDHAPHTLEEKREGAPGFPGVETMYPVMLALVKKGVVSLSDLIERICVRPAKIFGFERYSGVEVGNFANLAVFDMSDVVRIREDMLHSKAGWTPYEGFEAIFPKVVMIRGVEALRDGEVLVDKGFGAIAGARRL